MTLPAFTLDGLTVFGLFSVSAGLVCYALEAKSAWWVLGFAAANLCASAYGFLQGAWPFGLVELFWTAAGIWRFRTRRIAEARG
jgi:hypothetical protein